MVTRLPISDTHWPLKRRRNPRESRSGVVSAATRASRRRPGRSTAVSSSSSRGLSSDTADEPIEERGSGLRRDLLEPAAAVELPELGVAADRLPVDQDLRDGPAARHLL